MCAAYDASQLASGKPAVRDYASPTCGWAVRCTKAPILSVAKRSLSSESHVAWKRELGLGAYGGMELPAALYGRSALELRHGASGVRLSFCALEALRAWAALGAEPARHRNAAAPAEWDWTFTTPYRGATAVADFGDGVPAEPDGASFYDGGDGGGAAAGPAALRRPTCKCVFGRKPLLGGDEAAAAAAPPAAPPPPPPWRATAEAVDIERLLAAHPAPPPFEDSVELWCVFRLLGNLQTYCRRRDDLDPHSFAFFRVRVRFAGKFWVAFSRFFIRVNGVLARVLDTRFVGDESRVLRERTWREGDWETFAGPGAPPCVDFGGVGSRRPLCPSCSQRSSLFPEQLFLRVRPAALCDDSCSGRRPARGEAAAAQVQAHGRACVICGVLFIMCVFSASTSARCRSGEDRRDGAPRHAFTEALSPL